MCIFIQGLSRRRRRRNIRLCQHSEDTEEKFEQDKVQKVSISPSNLLKGPII